jgi:hypothetical protein
VDAYAEGEAPAPAAEEDAIDQDAPAAAAHDPNTSMGVPASADALGNADTTGNTDAAGNMEATPGNVAEELRVAQMAPAGDAAEQVGSTLVVHSAEQQICLL